LTADLEARFLDHLQPAPVVQRFLCFRAIAYDGDCRHTDRGARKQEAAIQELTPPCGGSAIVPAKLSEQDEPLIGSVDLRFDGRKAIAQLRPIVLQPSHLPAECLAL